MVFTTQTLSDIVSDLQVFLQNLEPDMSVSLDTPEGARIKSIAEAIYGLYVQMEELQNDIFPQDAETDALVKHATARLGDSPRKGATGSSGHLAATVYGDDGTTFSAGLTCVHSDGTRYRLTEGATFNSDEERTVSIEAISTGSTTNKDSGETLTLETPPSGMESTVDLVADLTGGTDQETDEELRVRLLKMFRNPKAGGRASDYWHWAMSIDQVYTAYVYCPNSNDEDCRRGLGTVDIAILKTGSKTDREPGAVLVAEVQDYIDDQRPCSVKSALVLDPDGSALDVTMTVTPHEGYEFDWTDPGTYTVSSWTAATRTLVWSAALPATLKTAVDNNEDPRILVNGEVLTVISYNDGANSTVVKEDPETTPAGSDPIRHGGPLSQPIITALNAYSDTLGPVRGTAADPNQWWEDTVRLAKLYDLVMGVTGVKDVTINTPVANQTPTDHGPSGTVDFLYINEITVVGA